MNRRRISQVLAVLLLMGLAMNWRLVLWGFQVRDLPGLLVGAIWLALGTATVIGLWRVRRWGVYALLALAPFSTVMLSIPLLPGMHLVGLNGPVAVALWNIVALLAGVAVLRMPHAPEPDTLAS